jgi:cytochrome c biogenesis protein CcmG/thiol:disulfide interchange protein DsbE
MSTPADGEAVGDAEGTDDQATSGDEPVVAGEDRPKTARIVSITVGVVLVALIALLGFAGGDDGESAGSPLIQERTPPIAGVAIDGQPFDIDDHRGSWVLVNFFATWCPGCVNEHDELVALEQWGADNGELQLVSVVFNDPVERVEEFFEQRGGTWPVMEDRGGISGDFHVLQIPESFLVSPSGQVVVHVEGEVAAQRIVEIIEGAG